MEARNKRFLVIGGVIFAIIVAVALVVYFFVPKLPSTQNADKTVIIDNYLKYTDHISPDSYGYLGNYLYEYINTPSQGVYHGDIVDGSYSYASDSWFSKFVVKLKDSDVSWNISMQTTKDGEINGDISVTCKSGGDACLEAPEKSNPSTALQDLLPINTFDYIITYQTDKYDTISIVYYDQEGTGKTKALDKIKSLGFKPEDYSIEYFYGGH